MNQTLHSDPILGVLDSTLSEMSVSELRHTILRVVDTLRHSQAQIIEIQARFEGALGAIAELESKNAELKDRILEIDESLVL
jgi:hypothetical protein